MMDKFVNDWLETGFTEIPGVKDEVRNENSLIPILTNEKGENQTPKPLFPSFTNESQLEPEFLPKYLSVLENKFRHADSIKLDACINEIEQEEEKQETPIREKISIDYDRKNIFLSRIMFNVFEMPDSSVLKGSAEYPKVLEKNQMYQDALERHKSFPENYVEESTQTHFRDTVEREIETDAVTCNSKACMINDYLLNEHYSRSEMETDPVPKTFTEFFEARTKFNNYSEFLSTVSSSPSMFHRVQDALYATEKILDYNTFRDSILKFNDCPADLYSVMVGKSNSTTNETSSDVVIKHHLTFHLDLMKNDFIVTCLECSPSNPNIFVAGYGVSVYDEMAYEYRGMVVCWNINKCGYPEKIYRTEEIVTCLEFSAAERYLVAVGMRYGLIALFDLQSPTPCASSNNYFSKVKPSGTIKSIRWYRKKFGIGDETHKLLSVSTDGAICSWTRGKYLEGSVLRSIKRGDTKRLVESGRRLVIAGDASGTCMEFQPERPDTFLVGTAEGEALLADINDSDAYREVFQCHDGPVQALHWSPFLTDVFVTTGTDRCVHVWEVGKSNPRKSLSLREDAFRVVWSRTKSTLLAALSRKKVLVYDLSVDIHREVAGYEAKGDACFSCLNFCPKNNWLVVGQSDGSVELLELCHVPEEEDDQCKALRKTLMAD